MSQRDDILKYMQEHGSITHKQCERYIGSTRLSARIYELEGLGYRIDREKVKVTCRGGRKAYITRYSLNDET